MSLLWRCAEGRSMKARRGRLLFGAAARDGGLAAWEKRPRLFGGRRCDV